MDRQIDCVVYVPPQPMTKFKRKTDVQSTWKEFGWAPPSDDPSIKAKWQFFRTLNAVMEDSGNV